MHFRVINMYVNIAHFISPTTSMKQRYSPFHLIGSRIVIDTHVHITHKMWKFSLTPKEMGSNHPVYFGKFSSLGKKIKIQNDSYKGDLWKKLCFYAQILNKFFLWLLASVVTSPLIERKPQGSINPQFQCLQFKRYQNMKLFF
jgi:hypothetical protein